MISPSALWRPASDTNAAAVTKKSSVRTSGPSGRGDEGVSLINRSRHARSRRRGRIHSLNVYNSLVREEKKTKKQKNEPALP
jgi:hypothetical protein